MPSEFCQVLTLSAIPMSAFEQRTQASFSSQVPSSSSLFTPHWTFIRSITSYFQLHPHPHHHLTLLFTLPHLHLHSHSHSTLPSPTICARSSWRRAPTASRWCSMIATPSSARSSPPPSAVPPHSHSLHFPHTPHFSHPSLSVTPTSPLLAPNPNPLLPLLPLPSTYGTDVLHSAMGGFRRDRTSYSVHGDAAQGGPRRPQTLPQLWDRVPHPHSNSTLPSPSHVYLSSSHLHAAVSLNPWPPLSPS